MPQAPQDPQDPLTPQTSQIRIRPARFEDAPVLLDLITQLAAHHGDTATLTLKELQRDVYFGPAPWAWVLVATYQGALCGYTALCPRLHLHFGQRDFEMHHLFVAEHQRGSGVGVALVNAARQMALDLNCQRLTVGTDPDNLAAQGFYLSQGFERRPSFPPRFAMALT